MPSLADRLLADPDLAAEPLCRALVPILTQPTGLTKAGYPYFQRQAWEAFRDGIPHILGNWSSINCPSIWTSVGCSAGVRPLS